LTIYASLQFPKRLVRAWSLPKHHHYDFKGEQRIKALATRDHSFVSQLINSFINSQTGELYDFSTFVFITN